LNICSESAIADPITERDSNEYQTVSEMAAQITIAAMARPGRSWMRALRNISGLLKKAVTSLLRCTLATVAARPAEPFPEPYARARSHYFSAGDSGVQALQGLYHFLDFADRGAGGYQVFDQLS
jgi:hypothetical protein